MITPWNRINYYSWRISGICQLLLESPRFCQLSDYICLAEQMAETYERMKVEETEAIVLFMSGNLAAAVAAATSDEPVTVPLGKGMPALLNRSEAAGSQVSRETLSLKMISSHISFSWELRISGHFNVSTGMKGKEC